MKSNPWRVPLTEGDRFLNPKIAVRSCYALLISRIKRVVELLEKNIDKDPFAQFSKWLNERVQPPDEESGAAVLATSGSDGQPSARVVLIKVFSRRGFIFYTSYGSRKALQISENNSAALLFFWPDMHRQVRIEGKIEKVSESKSDWYFRQRNQESQLSAWASEQSRPIPDRNFLESEVEFYREKFAARQIPRPPRWGGFILIPGWFEFWQEGKDRLHDRITYSLIDTIWKIERLAP